LLPSDLQKRAKIRQFCESINSFLHPLSNLKVLQYLEKKHHYNLAEKEAWVAHWYHKGLKALELMLVKNKGIFAFGDQVTFADCFIAPLVFTSERFHVDLSNYKNIVSVNTECLKLEAFQKAHPGRQIDTPESDRLSL
jgi:maleylacetoacetate isomerase